MEQVGVQVEAATVFGEVAPFQVLYHVVFTDEERKQCWAERTHAQCEELHSALSRSVSEAELPALPPIPPTRPRASEMRSAMNFYFASLSVFGPAKDGMIEFVKKSCVSRPESRYGEDGLHGMLFVWNEADSKWEEQYAILKDSTLSLFPAVLAYIDASVTPRVEIALQNVSVMDLSKYAPTDSMYVKGVKQYPYQVTTSDGKNWTFFSRSRAMRKTWVKALSQHTRKERGMSVSLSSLPPEKRKALDTMKELLYADAPLPEGVTERDLLRFLEDRNCDPQRGAALFWDDVIWRKNMDLKNLKVPGAGDWLKKGKVIVPGGLDKLGRPIVIFRARLHYPNTDTFDTIRLAAYAIERAIELYVNMPHVVNLQGDQEELVLIEDLTGFSRSQADNRIAKLLLELVQAHYPGRLGAFWAVNAPWYYRLLFKFVKPWLSLELQEKVHILGGCDQLLEFVDKDQLIPELGGTFPFELDAYIEERIEGVSPDGPNPHEPSEEILAIYCDRSVEFTIKNCTMRGWAKKQGGFIKNFNKRYCVLTPSVLYYYLDVKDTRAEGMLPLRGARVDETDSSTFSVVVAGKEGIFSCATQKENEEWVAAIRKAISKLEEESGSPSMLTVSDTPSRVDLRSSTSAMDLMSGSADPGEAFMSAGSAAFACPTFQVHFDYDEEPVLSRLWSALDKASGSGDAAAACVRYHQLLDISWKFQTAKSRPPLPCSGQALLSWLTGEEHSTEEVLLVLADMVTFGIIHVFNPPLQASPSRPRTDRVQQPVVEAMRFQKSAEYSFTEREPCPVMNSRFLSLRAAKPADQTLAELLKGIVQRYKSDGVVDIYRLRKKKTFRDFTVATSTLHLVDVSSLSPNEHTAFFLSLLHLMSVHATLMVDQPNMRSGIWSIEHNMSYLVGRDRLTLADIECGILRGNRPAPGSLRTSHWESDSPYARLVSSREFDPRIHFYANAGVFESDVLDIDWLSWEELDASLQKAAELFVAKDLRIDGKQVFISSLFLEYQSDFGDSESAVLKYINGFAKGAEHKALSKLLKSGKFTVNYTQYRRPRVGAAYIYG